MVELGLVLIFIIGGPILAMLCAGGRFHFQTGEESEAEE